DHDIEIAIPGTEGDQVPQIAHRQPPPQPRGGEVAERQCGGVVARVPWTRIVGEDGYVMTAGGQRVRQRVRDLLDAAALFAAARQPVAEHRDAVTVMHKSRTQDSNPKQPLPTRHVRGRRATDPAVPRDCTASTLAPDRSCRAFSAPPGLR